MRACVAAAGYKGEIRFEASTKGDNISTWFNQNEFITSQKAHDRIGWRPRRDGVIKSADQVYASWKATQSAA
jgi:hypothetical protein